MSARTSRFAAAALAALLGLTALVAPARAATAPDSTTYASQLTYSMLPLVPCAGMPDTLVIGLACPQCLGFHWLQRPDANHTVLSLVQASPGVCAQNACSPINVYDLLGLLPAGSGQQFVEVHVVFPPDSLHPQPDSLIFHKIFGYRVAASCGPAPLDSTYYLTRLYASMFPLEPCASRPETLVVNDACPKCQTPLGWYWPDANHTVVRVLQQPPAMCDTEICMDLQMRRPLGILPAGPGTQYIEYHAIIPADAQHPQPDSIVFHQTLTYNVAPACGVVPVDTTAYLSFLSFGLAPSRPCVSVPETLAVADSCWECLTYRWSRMPDPGHVVIGFTRDLYGQCVQGTCARISLQYPLGLLAAGPGAVDVEIHVVRLPDSTHAQPDSVIFHHRVAYDVAASCGTPPVDTSLVRSLLSVSLSPPHPCAAQPETVVVHDLCPGCLQPVFWRNVPLDGMNQRVVATFVADTSQKCALSDCLPADWKLPFGALAAGHHVFSIEAHVWTRFGPYQNPIDSVVVTYPLAFDVTDSCVHIAPGPLPFVTSVQVGVNPAPCDTCAPHACANAPVPVTIAGSLPGSCWHFINAGLQVAPVGRPPAPPVIALLFGYDAGNVCSDLVHPFSTTVSLPPAAPGRVPFLVDVQEIFPDSTKNLNTIAPFAYVADSCAATGTACAWPFLQPLPTPSFVDSVSACTLTLGSGGESPIVFAARGEGAPLAGIQGTLTAGPHLHLIAVDRSSATYGMHLVTQAHGDTALAYVLYADHGAPIPAGQWASALQVEVAADSGLAGGIESWVAGTVTAASDSLGRGVAPCPIMTLAVVRARVCIVAPVTCDANRDGVVNVADLVRMARCWYHPETCPDTLAARPDCNHDGTFHVDDIMCCARSILGGKSDSLAHAAPRLHVAFGAPEVVGDKLRVTLSVTGATDMNGALLHVKFPGDRYAVSAPTAVVGAGWLPLAETASGDVVLGLLRVDDAASDQLTVPLEFTLKAGQAPGGEVAIDQGQILAPDGSSLTTNLAAATATLPATGGAGITRIELLCAPNPAPGATNFVVRLPRAGAVDLGLYDVAGRRVATLWHGSMAAGATTVPWSASGVRGGAYFARLSVDGIVRTTRVTLQLGR